MQGAYHEGSAKNVAARRLKRRMTSHELISKDAFNRKQQQRLCKGHNYTENIIATRSSESKTRN